MIDRIIIHIHKTDKNKPKTLKSRSTSTRRTVGLEIGAVAVTSRY